LTYKFAERQSPYITSEHHAKIERSMTNLPATAQGKDVATLCAEHTRRVQLLTGQFWKGEIDLWHYRKLSRELTQQFVNELAAVLTQ
jgi:hypothetical protein